MGNVSSLELHFRTDIGVALHKTVFSLPYLHKPIVGLRYASSSVPAGFSCFKWSTGTAAIAVMFLQAKLHSMLGINDCPVLEGGPGSVARGVNIVLVKPRGWLFELFGYDSKGDPLLRRLVAIFNSNFRMGPLPIRIFFKSNVLNPANIKVFLDGEQLSSPKDIENLSGDLERFFNAKSKSRGSHISTIQSDEFPRLAA